VFIRAFGSLGNFDGRASFTTWVYRIARSHCLTAVTSSSARRRSRLTQVDDLEVPDPQAGKDLHEAELKGELERLLEKAGRYMPPDELDAFVMHYRDGLTVKEITRMLKCTNATGARTLIQNARRKFRRLVERED